MKTKLHTSFWTSNDADSALGGAGNEVLTGGADSDTLTRNDGIDQFVYVAATHSTAAATDIITVFNPATDVINLDAPIAVGPVALVAITKPGGVLNGTLNEFGGSRIAWWYDGSNSQAYVDLGGTPDNAFGTDDLQI